jgi:sugar phosphate isomerase/epimerase
MLIQPCVFTDEVSADFEEAVQLSVEAGATAMEIRGRLPGGSVTTISDADVGSMQATLAKFGARVGSIGSPFGKCDMENAEELAQHQRHFDRMLQLAECFGTPIIRGFALWKPKETGPETERPDLDPYMERIVQFLTPAVRKAEAAGAYLCLENEPSTLVGTCREAREVMDAVGSPALTVAWDVNNGVFCGEDVLAVGYPLIRGRVRHVHVKPNREKHMDTVGESAVTYAEVFQALLADGYAGAASIEHWGSPELMLRGVEELVETLERLGAAA